jgi:hypothetical protein
VALSGNHRRGRLHAHQWSSVVISGHQWSSVVTVPLTERSSQPGHSPRPSPCEPALQPATSTPPEVPTGAHLMRDAIRRTQTHSDAISRNQPPEVPTGAHVMPMRPSRRSKTSRTLEASTVSEIVSLALTHLWGSGRGRRGEHMHAEVQSRRADAPANLSRGVLVTPFGHRLAVDTHLWGTDERAPW